MEKTMKEYLAEAVHDYCADRSSQQKYLAVFFALVDVGMSEEKLELLRQTKRADNGVVDDAAYTGVTREGKRFYYVFTDVRGKSFTDGLYTEEITVRRLCNLIADEVEISGIVVTNPMGEDVVFTRDDVALLLEHVNSPMSL